MTVSDFGWVKYPFGALVVLVFVTILGLPYAVMARRRLPAYCLLLTPHVGIAVLVIGVTWYAFLGEPLRWWLLYLVALLVLGGVAFSQRGSLRPLRPGLRATALGLLPWLLGIGMATAFLLPAISSSVLPPGFVTSFTLTNNDVGSYVAEASNMAKAGFHNAGLYFHWNPGSDPASTFAARQDHTGGNAFMASVAAILGQPVWKIGEIAEMFLTASMLVSTLVLVRSFVGRAGKAVVVIAAFAAGSVFIWYLAANFFLAQLLCISLVMAQLALVQVARREFDWRIVLVLGLFAAATWLASPEVEVAGIVLVAGLILARAVATYVTRKPVRDVLRQVGSDALRFGGALALAALLSAPFMSDLISRSNRVAGTGIVGWMVDLSDAPLTVLGLSDPLGGPALGGPSGSALSTLLAVLLALGLIAALVWTIRRRDWTGVTAGVFVAATVLFSVFGVLRWGFTAYQSWKLIMTASVPFFAVGIVLLLRPLRPNARVVVLTVVAALAAVNVVAGSRPWEPLRTDPSLIRSHAVPVELTDLLQSPTLQRQRAINIYLPSQYLTMIAPAAYDKRAAMSSPSYLSGGRPGPHPYSCSLYDRALYKPPATPRERAQQRVVLTTPNYVLVATPSCA